MENGFSGFLAKPIELSALDRVLKTHLPKEYIEKNNNTVELMDTDVKSSSDITTTEEINKYIDTQTGLFYTGGSKDAYLSILETYVSKGMEKVEVINNLYSAKDWKNYIIEVHALKSSSMSIGAKELSELAKKMELAGKSGDIDVIDKGNADLLKLYETVLNHGKNLIDYNTDGTSDEPEEVQTESITKDEFIQIISEIREAINAFDSDIIIEKSESIIKYLSEKIIQNLFQTVEKRFNIV